MSDEDAYVLERIDFLVKAAFDNDDGTGKSFQMAIGLMQDILRAHKAAREQEATS